MDPHLCIGIDVGCKAHRVGIATPDGSILEEFDISHTDAGFQEFFRRVEQRRHQLSLPVAVAMEGYNGYARPLDRLVQEKSLGSDPAFCMTLRYACVMSRGTWGSGSDTCKSATASNRIVPHRA